MFPSLGRTDKTVIFGASGHGKSTLCKALQQANYRRLVIFDRMQEYPRGPGIQVVANWRAFAQAIRGSVGRDTFRIVYQFDVEARSHDAEFNEALRLVYYRGSAAVVIEEVWNFANPHFLPHWLKEILLTGRHRDLALMCTAQRPGEINKTLLSQARHIFAGAVHEGNDLRYLSEVMGSEVEKLPALPKGRFLHFQPGQASREVSNR